MVKRIVSLLLCLVMLPLTVSAVRGGDVRDAERDSGIRKSMRYERRNSDPSYFNPALYAAPYEDYTYSGEPGESLTVAVEDNYLVMKPEGAGVKWDIQVLGYYNNSLVISEIGDSEKKIDCSALEQGEAYFISLIITFSDRAFYDEAPVISMDSEGDVFFVMAKSYEVNRQRMEKLSMFGDPYEVFLKDQRDIEYDQYDVKKLAEDLTKDCKNDYEKVFAIYSYMTSEMYYDLDQLDYDNDVGYQDDVLTLLRRKIAICEGFSNTFVGLCRCCGIPASEVYGSGYDYDVMWLYVDVVNETNSNHAWNVVYLDGKWHTLDITWDNYNTYHDGVYESGEPTKDFFLLPLESISYTHLVMNADFSHSIPAEGSCGKDAKFKIDENGVCTIYGEGEVIMPEMNNDFFELRFDEHSNITAIGEDGFFNCDQLTKVILPDTILRIDDYAFMSCEDLEYIYIPESVVSIGFEAFYLCDKLSYCRVPDGVKIGDRAFDNCPRLILDIQSKKKISFDGYLVRPVRVIARDEQ